MLKDVFFGYEVEIDLETTQRWYATAKPKKGQYGAAAEVRNFRAAAKERQLPTFVLEYLDKLGIPPQKATYIRCVNTRDGNNFYTFSYRMTGNILKESQANECGCWCLHEPSPVCPQDFPEPHFDLEFYASVPWVLDEPNLLDFHPPGDIVLISGAPGTGKTAAASIFTKETLAYRTVHLRMDDFYRGLGKRAIPPDQPEADAQNQVVIEAISEAARRFARRSYRVIVDGVIRPRYLKPWLQIAKDRWSSGTAVHYIILRTDRDETMRRTVGQDKPSPEADAALVETMWAQFCELGAYEKNVIDTTALSVEDVVSAIESAVKGNTHLLPED